MEKIDLFGIAKEISKPHQPVVVAQVEDHVVRLAKFEGERRKEPHKHDDFDEFFLVIQGKITLTVDGTSFNLNQNQGLMVPKGVYHHPYAKEEALVLMFEHKDL